jgi:hypothetical protein
MDRTALRVFDDYEGRRVAEFSSQQTQDAALRNLKALSLIVRVVGQGR